MSLFDFLAGIAGNATGNTVSEEIKRLQAQDDALFTHSMKREIERVNEWIDNNNRLGRPGLFDGKGKLYYIDRDGRKVYYS